MQVDRLALERAVGAVPGVAGATIDDAPGSWGGAAAGRPDLGTLHLTLQPGADEVAVATAVDRIVREQFGLGVDPERIDLVEESAPEPRLRAVPPESMRPTVVRDPALGAALALALVRPRLSIRRLQVVSSGLGVAATVTLAHGDVEHAGTADGPATQAGVQRAVAVATLAAVQSAVDVGPGDTRFDVEAVGVPVVGGSRVVVVQVSVTTAAGNERLTGAAEVRDDVRQAVVRATLDGLNRRLEALLDAR